jgi:hypothetical protein
MANSGSTSTTARAPRVGHLTRTSDVLRECRRVYRMARSGEIETSDMSRYVNCLQIMVNIMRTGDLEQRLEALEEARNAKP